MHRSTFTPLLALVGFALVPRLDAQPIPLGVEHQVNTTTALHQGSPRIAMDAEGGYVVVWNDGTSATSELSNTFDGDGWGIVGQRFDRDGQPIAGEFLVNNQTSNRQETPGIAMDATGNFVVVWTDWAGNGNPGDGDLTGISGRRFDNQGNPLGPQFQVNEVTASRQDRASVAMDSQGNFVVVWGGPAIPGIREVNLFARAFAAEGAPRGGQFSVNTTQPAQWRPPAIDFAPDGSFVIGWLSPNRPFNYARVRRFDSDGTPASGEIQINTELFAPLQEIDLRVGPSGDFVVVWSALDIQSGLGFEIRGRRFDPLGDPIGPEFAVNSTTLSNQGFPNLGMDSAGNFAVTWSSFVPDNGTGEIFAQQFDSEANRLGGELRVSTASNQTGGLRQPGLAMEPGGDFVVVWDDGGSTTDSQDGDGLGVRAQRYDGNLPDPSLVSHAALDEGSGTMIDLGDGLSGDLTGGATWTQGQQGSAIEFDGSTGYVEVLDSGTSPLDVSVLTLATWVRPERVGSDTQVLISKDDAYELELGRNFPHDRWELRIDNGSPGAADTPIQEGVWQHLAATWDGTTIRYYRNGQPDGSLAHTATIDSTNNENVGLGARPAAAADGGPTFFFQGAMDDVRIYGRVLDDAEILALFTTSVTDIDPPVRSNPQPDGVVASAPVVVGLDTDEPASCKFGEVADTRYADLPSVFASTGGTNHDESLTPAGSTTLLSVRCRDTLGNTNTSDLTIGVGIGPSDISSQLQGEWLFEEGTGCTTADESATQIGDLSNTLGTCDALDNSPQWQTNEADPIPGPCFSGSCLSFDGDDQVSIPVVDGLRVRPQELTVSVWVRHDPIHGTYSNAVDLRGTDVGSGLQALGFTLALDASGKGYFKVRGTTVVGSLDVDDGAWHHLVGVWREGPVGTGSTRLYVDGVLDTGLNEGSATFDLAPSTLLQIGHRFNANETLHNFKGELDTVSLYDRELSDLEVFDLYLATRP